MNAGPHYQKLYTRVTHIRGNRRSQPSRSAMKGPHPERTSYLIKVPLASGKFMLDIAKSAHTGECAMDWTKSRRVLPARKRLGGRSLPPH